MAYRPIEHTADLGIEAWAATLEGLFGECLRAQTDTLTRLDRVADRQRRRLELEAPDLPGLLVEFLGEAIYLHETEGLVLCDADLEVEQSDGGWSLSGSVGGELFDLDRHGLKTLLKGVTYHQLEVRRRGGEWRARVIFDI